MTDGKDNASTGPGDSGTAGTGAAETGGGGTDAEELLAKALRAHAARAQVPSTPRELPKPPAEPEPESSADAASDAAGESPDEPADEEVAEPATSAADEAAAAEIAAAETDAEITGPAAAVGPTPTDRDADEQAPVHPNGADQISDADRTQVVRPVTEPQADPEDEPPKDPDQVETTAHATPVGERTTGITPVPESANERTGATRLNMNWPLGTHDRMLAPHDVDSSLQIEAEFGPGYATNAGYQSSADYPATPGYPPETAYPAAADTDEHWSPDPAYRPRALLPVRWILLLAVLLGLATGAIAGLLTIL